MARGVQEGIAHAIYFLKQPRQAVWQLATSIGAGISPMDFQPEPHNQAIAASALGLSGSCATHFSIGGTNSFTSDWSVMICA